MNNFINILIIIISVLLVTVILLQNRGSGVSGVFGGEGNVYRTKRGAEKFLFYATIVLAVLFFGVSLYSALFLQ